MLLVGLAFICIYFIKICTKKGITNFKSRGMDLMIFRFKSNIKLKLCLNILIFH